MGDPIIKPIEFIVEAVKFIICLIAYIGNIFTWTGKAIAIGIKVLLAMPFCVFFYILHAVWEFFLFVIFDILLIIIFWPSRALAKALDYPIKIPTNKRQLKRIKS